MVARRYPPDVISGTETVFQNLYQQARSRHEVRLLVGYTRDRSLVPPEALAVDLRGASKPQAWSRMWRQARQEIKRFQPDVILGNSIEIPSRGAPAACIVHDLNFGGADANLSTRAKAAFYQLQSHRLRAVFTVSEASKEHLLRAGLREDRIHVVHNGVDREVFQPREVSLESLPADKFTFSYPSRIIPGKGQHLALDAVARLRREYKERAHLCIVGTAPDRIFLDRLQVQAWEQPASICTEVPEIAPYYQAADAVVFPTVMEEGFGFTAIEAMACGKPVIWSDQPAIREATGGIGLAVPRGDVDALRAAMMRLMDDPALCQELGEQGRAFVADRYDWRQVWARYELVLQGIAR